jgi:hypothetical protein
VSPSASPPYRACPRTLLTARRAYQGGAVLDYERTPAFVLCAGTLCWSCAALCGTSSGRRKNIEKQIEDPDLNDLNEDHYLIPIPINYKKKKQIEEENQLILFQMRLFVRNQELVAIKQYCMQQIKKLKISQKMRCHKKTEQIETKIDPSIKLFSSLAAEISPSTPSVNTQTSIHKQKK